MFKRWSQLAFNREFKRQFSNSPLEKWDLMTAVCVERKPIITRPLTELEKNYKNLLQQVEFERSLKSDHEMRHEKEQHQIEQLKKGDDIEVHLKDTAQDFVDANTEELSKFKFGDRITEADKKNDLKSLNRKLDRHLVLVVKQKIGKDDMFMLPQDLRKDGESLRQTADRILQKTCGDDVKAMVYGNAPAGFYKYKYPQPVRQKGESIGAKVFIYFARYEKGKLPTTSSDYKWLDRAELQTVLPKGYSKSVLEMLIDE